MLFGKKKRNIAFLLGCLWYYIKRIDDVEDFAIATDLMVELCVKLGIEWKAVNDGEMAYQTWDAFQSDCL